MALLDPDRLLGAWMEALTVFHRKKVGLGLATRRWRPGDKLRLLFAGYNGTRNTGADVRVEEMIRQIKYLLGEENADLSVLTIDPALTRGYFAGLGQVTLPQIFPHFLYSTIPSYDGVVACEGSMFKSKFANALSIMMAGSLGMANAEGKLSIGYGAEVGKMTPDLTAFVRRACRESLVICRNEPSRRLLDGLGIRNLGGTDTAWTFAPAPPARGRALLQGKGWDGKKEVLFVCPINPFWWPVKPSVGKFLANKLFGRHRETHYKSVYFHEYDAAQRARYETYLRALADATRALEKERGVFTVFVAMEALDRHACADLARAMGRDVPTFLGGEHDMFEMVSVLRQGAYMVSSRFHAVVTGMGGLVAPIGVTMDERLRNVLTDAGLPENVLEVDEADLAAKLTRSLLALPARKAGVRDKIRAFLPSQFRKMGEMGLAFLDEVARVYPDFPRNPAIRTWRDALPPLDPEVQKMVDGTVEAMSA